VLLRSGQAISRDMRVVANQQAPAAAKDSRSFTKCHAASCVPAGALRRCRFTAPVSGRMETR